MFSSPLQQ